MSSGVTLDTLQDKQTLDDFVEAKRGGICGIMGDRYINIGNGNSNSNSNNNRNNNSNNNSNDNSNKNWRSRFADSNSNMLIWYIDANNLYGYAMMQKLPYKDYKYSDTSLDSILNTPDDSDHGYYIDCDINYTNNCKDRTEQLAIMHNKRMRNDNEVSYIDGGAGKARSEKLMLDQNNKTEYMVHYRMLKFYVKMGVTATKIHRVINFK